MDTLKKFLNKIFTPKQLQVTVPKEKIFIPLPYFGSPSQELIKFFKNKLANVYPQIEIKTFALTIRLKFHNFSDSKTNCLLRCAPTLKVVLQHYFVLQNKK